MDSAEGQAAPQGYFKENGQNSYDEDAYSYDGTTTSRVQTHRAYPDLAFAGAAVQMVDQGKVVLVDGTSAAAPLFAAMVAGIVADRKAEGLQQNADEQDAGYANGCDEGTTCSSWKATQGFMLGWLNPTLYAHAAAFTDVTEGTNTNGRGVVCPPKGDSYYSGQSYFYNTNNDDHHDNAIVGEAAGFSATTGWDPVSGLGSIGYPSLKALFPKTLATDAGAGNLGDMYYEQEELGDHAEIMERYPPPTPPAYYYG